MDGITLDEFKSVFGNSLLDLSKGQEKQTSILTNIQNIIDQKIDKAIEHLEKLSDNANSLTGGKKSNTSETESKPQSIPSRIAGALSSVLSPSRSPYARDTVNIDFTDKAKVTLQDILNVKIEALYDRFAPHLEDISETLKAILQNTIKPGEKPKGLLDYLGDIAKLMAPILAPLLLMLGGAAASIAGIAALISGLTDTGPLKGLKKLLARGGISLALNMVEKGASKLMKAFSTIGKIFFSEKAIENLKGMFGRVSKTIFDKVSFLPKLFFNKVKTFLSKIPSRLVMYVKSFFGAGEKALADGVKVVPKVAKGGIFKSLLSGLGKFFSKNVLKRIPIVGTILGLSFAYSRFKDGDTIGGIVDVVSALAGLLDLVAPGLGTALSVGLDVFNAFLDMKAGGADDKSQGKKLDILKDVGVKIGRAVKGMIYGILDWILGALPDFARSPVEKVLKGLGIDLQGYQAEQAKEAEVIAREATATKTQSLESTSRSTIDTNTTPIPRDVSIQPAERSAPTAATLQPQATSNEGIDGMHGSIKEQNNVMRQLLTFSQQTAENTNNLILKFEENIGGKNIQINNVSNPTTFLATPASSSNFRAAAFGR